MDCSSFACCVASLASRRLNKHDGGGRDKHLSIFFVVFVVVAVVAVVASQLLFAYFDYVT